MCRSREERLAETFVELADTLVADFDPLGLLRVLAAGIEELLDVTAVALLLSLSPQQLTAAGNCGRTQELELLQVRTGEGPGVDCVRTGAPVVEVELRRTAGRWPRFAAAACAAGYAAVHALPMRLRSEVIGSATLLRDRSGPLSAEEVRIATSIVDVATIGLVQERTIRARETLATQLQNALSSRIVIEQAKGILAERFGVSMGEAFDTLRRHARSHNLRLPDAARAVIEGAEGVPTGPAARAGTTGLDSAVMAARPGEH